MMGGISFRNSSTGLRRDSDLDEECLLDLMSRIFLTLASSWKISYGDSCTNVKSCLLRMSRG